jgi:hypothetical protein
MIYDIILWYVLVWVHVEDKDEEERDALDRLMMKVRGVGVRSEP